MDPLNLTAPMRKAFDFIRTNGSAVQGEVTYPTARALRERGLIELYEVSSGSASSGAWVALPLGSPRPKRVKVPAPPVATAQSVSRTLGSYKAKDGSKLTRTETVRNHAGVWTRGGYQVMRGSAENIILVSYVSGDEESLTEVLDKRPAMLKMYAEILRKAKYKVTEDIEFGVLRVSK